MSLYHEKSNSHEITYAILSVIEEQCHTSREIKFTPDCLYNIELHYIMVVKYQSDQIQIELLMQYRMSWHKDGVVSVRSNSHPINYFSSTWFHDAIP